MHLKHRHLLSKGRLRRWYFEVGIPMLIPPEGRDSLGRMEIYGPVALIDALERRVFCIHDKISNPPIR